ncbi:ABC transporter permease [Phocaeicola plebeius]|uniref:ABC transporter permease n=1 Tax=Phocaeicola plebeius TaxID=310297 RepID=UPI003567D9B1
MRGDVYQIACQPGKLSQVIDYLRKLEREVYGTENFQYSLLKDDVQKLYKSDQQVATIYSAFAFIAIVISCLGLLGISLFDIRQRYREIAIRKVNGAMLKDLYVLLLRRYLGMLLLAAVVAVPLAWLAIYYYTADLVVKAPVTVGLFLTAFLIVAVISVATLLWQVNKASRINPSEVMKSE